MALKGDRSILDVDITLTCESVAEMGLVLCHKTGSSGSGVAIGDSAGKADLIANPSGYKVAGLLMNDVVNVDQTRYHLNFHKDEIQRGNRCTLLRKGWVVTDKVGGTPAVGDTAYLHSSGYLFPTKNGVANNPPVGTFASIKDADGYAKVDLNLPVSIL